jgi:hypothetical protein
MRKRLYISTLILAYINHTTMITPTADVYILPFINALDGAYVCKIALPDNG